MAKKAGTTRGVMALVPGGTVNLHDPYLWVNKRCAPGGWVLIRWGSTIGHAVALVHVKSSGKHLEINEIRISDAPWHPEIYRLLGMRHESLSPELLAAFPFRKLGALLNTREVRALVEFQLSNKPEIPTFDDQPGIVWAHDGNFDQWLGASPTPSPLKPAKHAVLTDDFLRQVADHYLYAVEEGKFPVDFIWKPLSKHYSKPTVRMWITRARQAGFLPAGKRHPAGM